MDDNLAALRIRVTIDHESLSLYLSSHAEEIKVRCAAGNRLAMRIERRVDQLLNSPTNKTAENLDAAVYYYKMAVEN
jgi:hypothetical protein